MTEPQPFSYRQSIAPMMWAFVGLGTIELVVVHFLLSFWSPTLALILSLLSLATIGWLIALLVSFKRLPVLVGPEEVVMRVGTMHGFNIPAGQVARLRTNFTSEDVKRPGIADLCLLAYPNVLLDLDPPLPGKRRPINGIAHRLDDPNGFAAAVARLLSRERNDLAS